MCVGHAGRRAAPRRAQHPRRTRAAVARRKKSRLRGAQQDGDGSEERPDRGGAPSGEPRRTEDAPEGVDGVRAFSLNMKIVQF